MLLAGDVGGTKTLIGSFASDGGRPRQLGVATLSTAAFEDFPALVSRFLEEHGLSSSRVDAAAFGVAGPVVGQVARMTNTSLTVDGAALARRFDISRVLILNDLEAMAFAVPVLGPHELRVLQAGRPSPDGNAALIAAGTGLGEALLHRVDGRLVPAPTEGGHADFAARNAAEIVVLRALTAEFGRVDCERVVSGPGLVNLHRVLHRGGPPCPAVGAGGEIQAADVSAAALDHRCPRCERALDLFVEAYGAEAGNLALKALATSGVFIGGGIAPKILPALEAGRFIAAFCDKAPMTDLLADIPVSVILDERVALLGAAVAAASLARAGIRP
jgi:glucokinase